MSDEPTNKYYPTLQFLLAVWGILVSFSVFVLVLQPATLLFCLTLDILIGIIFGRTKQLFSGKKLW